MKDVRWRLLAGWMLVAATAVSADHIGYADEHSVAASEARCAGSPEAAAEWLQALEVEDQARQIERLRTASGVEARIVTLVKFQHLMDEDERVSLLRETLAGASTQPRLLATLVSVCSKMRNPAGLCDGLAERIVALEPSNAWGWMQLAGEAQRAGDDEAARIALLASARSSHYTSPDRTLLNLLWTARRADPPSAALASARHSRILSEQAPTDDGSLRCEPAEILEDAAMDTLGHTLAATSQHFTATQSHCARALPAQDTALLQACRRLLRMVEDQAFAVVDVQMALALSSTIETPSEAGAASMREAQLQTLLGELASLVAPEGYPGNVSLRQLLEFQLEHGGMATLRHLVDVLASAGVGQDLRDGTESP